MDTAIVVGAGPAGLAAAAQLRRAGIPAVVLEQGAAIAPQWRARYDRLRLNSPRWFSALAAGAAGGPHAAEHPHPRADRRAAGGALPGVPPRIGDAAVRLNVVRA